MSEENRTTKGPVMLCATPVLKPGRARISRISNGITLPRTVEVVSLAAGVAGAVIGLILMLIFTRSWQSLMAAAVVGGTLGWVSTTWSPLKGESLAKWLGLKASRNRNTINRYGKRVVVYVGVAPLTRINEGTTTVQLGATDVFPGSVDSEGRPARDVLGESQRYANTQKEPSVGTSLRKPSVKATKDTK